MNAPLRAPFQFDVTVLAQVIADNASNDALAPQLTPTQWDLLATYLQPFALAQGQVLIEQGAIDQTIYLVESGSLTVHYQDSKGRVRLAIVAAGSAVGEGAFFRRGPRLANVQAAAPSKIWALTPLRFSELSKRNPALALQLTLALGSLVSRRLVNKPKRVAVT